MTQEEINKRISEIVLQQSEFNQRYSAYMQLYTAACMANNGAEMEEYRQIVLSVVEKIMDNMATQWLLNRQLIAMMRGES